MKIKTSDKRQVIDITDEVAESVPHGRGVVTVSVTHTTAALTTADLDPGTDEDLLDALSELLPDKNWRHPHDSSYEHVSSHLLSSIIGPSISLPFSEGQLQLGTWQRIVLVELDGPRERQLEVVAIGN